MPSYKNNIGGRTYVSGNGKSSTTTVRDNTGRTVSKTHNNGSSTYRYDYKPSQNGRSSSVTTSYKKNK
jgi:hypothetical protein